MKILITGGAGFIGVNLCRELIKCKEYKIYSLDNYSSGLKTRHIKGVEYIEGDTENIENLISFVPDIIYHLGEYSRVAESFANIEKVINCNLTGTAKVLEFWRKSNCKLIYAGSSTKFSDNFEKEASPYSVTKNNNTYLIKKYGEWFDLKYAICYFHNVYGQGENSEGEYKTLIATFLNLKKQNKDVKVFLPGTQRRNFTHVDDIVSGLKLLLHTGSGDGYSFGAREDYSILDIVNMLSSRFVFADPVKGDRVDSVCDTEKSKKDLGWRQEKTLANYIESELTQVS